MLWYYTLQKQKVCYLLRDQNSKFAHFIIISVSKLITLNKFTSTAILASLLMMNSAGSHTLHMYIRQCQKKTTTTKKFIFFLLSQLRHFVGTSKRKLFYHAHISSHFTVSNGCSDISFKKLNYLHRRAAK